MFAKIVALCAVAAVAQAGLLAAPAHYSPAEAVSSQSIVRHDQQQAHLLAPVAKLAVAAPVYHAAPAPVTYHAAPASIAYHAAPASVYHAAPASVYHAAPASVYHAAPAPVAYHAAPVKYSSASSVSSQNIVRYDQPQAAKIVAPIAKVAISAPVYHSAPAPVAHYSAPIAHYSAPVAHYSAPIAHQEENAHPKYEYTYSVADAHTGDNKSQQEVRDGDVVKGSYSFHEADGSIRTVEYSADDHSGFNAVVHNTAPTAAPTLIKAAPAYAAPIYYKH